MVMFAIFWELDWQWVCSSISLLHVSTILLSCYWDEEFSIWSLWDLFNLFNMIIDQKGNNLQLSELSKKNRHLSFSGIPFSTNEDLSGIFLLWKAQRSALFPQGLKRGVSWGRCLSWIEFKEHNPLRTSFLLDWKRRANVFWRILRVWPLGLRTERFPNLSAFELLRSGSYWCDLKSEGWILLESLLEFALNLLIWLIWVIVFGTSCLWCYTLIQASESWVVSYWTDGSDAFIIFTFFFWIFSVGLYFIQNFFKFLNDSVQTFLLLDLC